MRNSKRALGVVEAHNKGYLVDGSGTVWYKGKIVKGNKKAAQGIYYLFLTIRMPDKSLQAVPVHQLHAYQKYGDSAISKGMVVRHIDGDSLNNSWKNIAIGSMSDNMMDRDPIERKTHSITAAAYQVKYDAEAIRKDHNNGLSYRDIMSKYDISSKGTVSHIINKRQIMKPLDAPVV